MLSAARHSLHLATTYTALRNATDITYVVEVSGDLLGWQSGSIYTAQVSMTPLDAARQQAVVRDNVPESAGQTRFLRVRVSQP